MTNQTNTTKVTKEQIQTLVDATDNMLQSWPNLYIAYKSIQGGHMALANAIKAGDYPTLVKITASTIQAYRTSATIAIKYPQVVANAASQGELLHKAINSAQLYLTVANITKWTSDSLADMDKAAHEKDKTDIYRKAVQTLRDMAKQAKADKEADKQANQIKAEESDIQDDTDNTDNTDNPYNRGIALITAIAGPLGALLRETDIMDIMADTPEMGQLVQMMATLANATKQTKQAKVA